VAAVVPLGKPVRQLSKLRRQGVETFTTRERFDGRPFQQDGFVAPDGKRTQETE
jgi:hypothetical protein